MHRFFVNAAVASVLMATGWVVAKAQTPPLPDFEIVVEAPGGATTIRCVRGCKLAWVERGVNPNSEPVESFDFACSGARCSSARVGGWVVQ